MVISLLLPFLPIFINNWEMLDIIFEIQMKEKNLEIHDDKL